MMCWGWYRRRYRPVPGQTTQYVIQVETAGCGTGKEYHSHHSPPAPRQDSGVPLDPLKKVATLLRVEVHIPSLPALIHYPEVSHIRPGVLITSRQWGDSWLTGLVHGPSAPMVFLECELTMIYSHCINPITQYIIKIFRQCFHENLQPDVLSRWKLEQWSI